MWWQFGLRDPGRAPLPALWWHLGESWLGPQAPRWRPGLGWSRRLVLFWEEAFGWGEVGPQSIAVTLQKSHNPEDVSSPFAG